jgi:hypothetical protein
LLQFFPQDSRLAEDGEQLMVAVCEEGQAVGEGLREILPALATLGSVDPEEKTVMRAGMVRVIRRMNLPAGRKLSKVNNCTCVFSI